MTVNLFDYANVTLSDKATKEGVTRGMTFAAPIHNVLVKLVTERPLWRFMVMGKNYNNRIDEVDICQDGEVLGSLNLVYYRGAHCVEVKNNRLSKERQRGNGYRTKDTDKAVATVKKMFSRMSTSERLSHALKEASSAFDKLARNKSQEQYRATNQLKAEAVTFAFGMGVTEFKKYLQDNRKVDWYEKKEVADSEMQTIADAKKKFEDRKTVLVVRTDGQYVVRTAGHVELFDDNTLPEKYKAKLGMLKLVEDEEFITTVGCRVNAEIFVLLDEELENE